MGTNKLGIVFAGMSFIPFYAATLNNKNYVREVSVHASLGAPNLEVYEVNNVPKIENLKMSYADERCLRWQNITRAVETRYNLPENILLSMMRHESGGNPLLPNLGRRTYSTSQINTIKYVSSIPVIGSEFKPHLLPGDGGAGLIHMQPLSSSKYGVKTISESKKLIDKEQGVLISKKLEETNYDLALMAVSDQRFNPVINIDAAGRMIADFYLQSPATTESEKWDYAIYRYSGRQDYPSKIREFMNKIRDKNHLEIIEKRFDRINKNATIDGNKLTFDACIDFYQRYAESQFDLKNYIRQTTVVKERIVPLIASIQKNDYSDYKPTEKLAVKEKPSVIENYEQDYLFNFPSQKITKASKKVSHRIEKPTHKVSKLKKEEPIIKVKEYDLSPALDSIAMQIVKPIVKRKHKEPRRENIRQNTIPSIRQNVRYDKKDDLVAIVVNNTVANNNYVDKTAEKKTSKNKKYSMNSTSVNNEVDPNDDEEYRNIQKLIIGKKELKIDKKENSISQDIDDGVRSIDNIVPLITREYPRKIEKTAQYYSDNIPALQSIKHGLIPPITLLGSNEYKKSNDSSVLKSQEYSNIIKLRGLDELLAEDFIAKGSIADELNRVA